MLAIAGAIGGVTLIVVIIATPGGGSDGPAAFLSRDAESALFVQWTRVDDDVSGTLAGAYISQPQPGLFSSMAHPPG